ncbi:MAG: ATP-binding protein [Peptoniphilus harei]|uniref:ATP-binding protein n=1 Tax=Peptoniphilus harei TaxID=54005 RepID=UPI002901E6DB|nr:ATP-binding protein [Peptoniphilus harei]MDU3086833.1 ATP-binding protein [Peptoniphilus harei]
MSKVDFTTSNNAVTHLGRNLYSTSPPAISELVANSYDGYATEVNISLDKENSIIVIADNGKGLNIDEIRKKYATFGQEKQPEDPPTGLEIRKPMGKKGIGKLAAFSLGNLYEVYTRTENSNKWINFGLPYNKMLNTNKYSTEINELDLLPDYINEFNEYKSGFIIVISELRRNITSSTVENLKLQLSRRFYINQKKSKFKLKINGNSIDLESKVFYDKIQYVTYFGECCEDNLKAKFNNLEIIEEYKKESDVSKFFKDEKINGWIGTTMKPKDLKIKGGPSFANIIVSYNGKIVDENILKNCESARIANNYIVGEINADGFLEILGDPITSSRQGLDDNIPQVESFINNVRIVRNFVIDRWDEIRQKNAVKSLPVRIKNDKSYQNWLNSLTSNQKKINNKLLNLLSTRLDEDEEVNSREVNSMVTSIASVINNIESDELISALNQDVSKSETYNLLLKLMSNIAKTEDIKHSNLIKKRLEAIDKLEKLMNNDGTPEKLFEEHLSDNPWLINPYWNIDRNNPTRTDYLKNQEFFKLEKGDEEFERNFLDISIRVAEEKYPVIVELKKNTVDGYSGVNFAMIYNQVTKYRRAMIQNIPELEDVEETKIKVIFILSEDSGSISSNNKIKFSNNELKLLEESNIEILKYNKILASSRKMYREHLEYQKSINLIPDL